MALLKTLFCLTLYFAQSLVFAELHTISRTEWRGQDPDGEIDDLKTPVGKVIIMHTATNLCNDRRSCDKKVRNIQAIHMSGRHFSDIGYNFLIGGDGSIYEGRGWKKVGAHTRGFNAGSVGITFIGNFEEDVPSEAALSAGQELIAEGVRQNMISSDYKLFAHRQLTSTSSPGEALYSILKQWPHWTKTL